jgi:hypothetical protein
LGSGFRTQSSPKRKPAAHPVIHSTPLPGLPARFRPLALCGCDRSIHPSHSKPYARLLLRLRRGLLPSHLDLKAIDQDVPAALPRPGCFSHTPFLIPDGSDGPPSTGDHVVRLWQGDRSTSISMALLADRLDVGITTSVSGEAESYVMIGTTLKVGLFSV